MNRSTWHARTSAVVLAWLAAAALVALAHRQVPASTWLMVHLLMLGAVTNALVIWSWHFTVAVLRAPPARSRRGEVLRLVASTRAHSRSLRGCCSTLRPPWLSAPWSWLALCSAMSWRCSR